MHIRSLQRHLANGLGKFMNEICWHTQTSQAEFSPICRNNTTNYEPINVKIGVVRVLTLIND